MKKTWAEIQEIDQIVGKLYKKEPTLVDTKFGYAYKRYYAKNFTPHYEELGNILLEININNALEDPTTKALLLDRENQRGYKYSKEGLIKCIKEGNEAVNKFNQIEFEIIPFKSSMVPKGLSKEETELLTGVVL